MDELSRILIFGILAMSTLAIAIVIFFVIYQRRLLAQQEQIREAESRYQKELLNASIQTQEVERQRIAKDLHDSVGSTLSATKLFLYRLDNRQQDGEFSQLKTEAARMIDDTIVNIRNTTRNLLPVNLERFGLVAALEDLFRQTEQLDVLKIDFQYNKEQRFTAEKELALYRIVQELLNNSLKHAGAGQIKAELNFEAAGLKLLYRDDGVGFDPRKYRSGDGIGLKSIKSRVEFLQAACVLETGKGQGVLVKLDCPDIGLPAGPEA